MFAALPPIASGQTYPEIKRWMDISAPSFGSAAVDNLNGDGLPEIVLGTYFNDEMIRVGGYGTSSSPQNNYDRAI